MARQGRRLCHPGRAEALVRHVGIRSGVVGLPLFETARLLRAAGYPLG
jgi:predicted house-cleaning NTP pyrophosphatase (Maf/HAM1 superfamily)